MTRHARLVLLAAVIACASLLAAPAPSPRGEVLDLVSDPNPDPVSAGAATLSPSPAASPAARPGPTQAPSPSPAAGSSSTPSSLADGGPPQRRAVGDPAPTAPPVETLNGYSWPIAHPRLTQPFGPSPYGSRVVDGEPFHDGIDIATFCGDRILAAHDGTVLAASRQFDEHIGWVGDLRPYYARLDRKGLWMTLPIVVVIDDGNGYRSMYAHLGRTVVKAGDRVRAGQLLGYEGATGRASGCHLHYGLFSPWEDETFGIKADVAKRMKLPRLEIARIDPLLVLPPTKRIP